MAQRNKPLTPPSPLQKGRGGLKGAAPAPKTSSHRKGRGSKGDGVDVRFWRVLDANVNRAREGLRIVEDTARFVLHKGGAARAFRAMRHNLDALVRKHYKTLLAHRDVAQDSGRSNRSVPYRGGVDELLAANLKRCQEALRVLEEYGRILSPRTVKTAQALRFEVYRWEKKLHDDP